MDGTGDSGIQLAGPKVENQKYKHCCNPPVDLGLRKGEVLPLQLHNCFSALGVFCGPHIGPSWPPATRYLRDRDQRSDPKVKMWNQSLPKIVAILEAR